MTDSTTTTDAVPGETTDVVPTTTTDAVPGETTDAQPLLQVDDISLRFGGVTAIDAVSFEVRDGELFAIIGPNGAGKTSIFNSISQVYQPQSGDIRWKGASIMGTRPDRVARLGVARTFQNIELFPQMTVLDNLLTGRHIRMSSSFIAGALWVGKAKREEIEHRRRVEDIIDFLEIEGWRKHPVALLPYGIQKRVELGRALAMDPELLMLDEPVAGMNLEETEDMARFILDIRRELGISLLMVEHDMGLVARTFQNIELFPQMTVLDNLLTGRHIRMSSSFLAGAVWVGKAKREEIEHRRRVEDIIDFLEIERWRKHPVALLPYGIQKRVELGRALAMEPELLMLDEPVAGMNLEETEDMARFILDIRRELGISLLMVEHDMGLVMDIADRVMVLDFGQRIAEGTPAEVQRDPRVIAAYLGSTDLDTTPAR